MQACANTHVLKVATYSSCKCKMVNDRLLDALAASHAALVHQHTYKRVTDERMCLLRMYKVQSSSILHYVRSWPLASSNRPLYAMMPPEAGKTGARKPTTLAALLA